jgi:ankyrin repeat protein
MDSGNKPNLSKLLKHAEASFGICCRGASGEIDLFSKSSCGDTLIHVAAMRGNFRELTYLIDVGLSLNDRGDFLETPLFQAAAMGQVAMVGFLLKHGADPTIPDHRGVLPEQALLRKLSKFDDLYLNQLMKWFLSNPPS